MKFSKLPVEVQTAVTNELKSVKIDFINQQVRYYANYGYKSAQDYRKFLTDNPYKVDANTMINTVKSVLIDLLKSGKDYLHLLPVNVAHNLRENLMLSKVEIARKVQ